MSIYPENVYAVADALRDRYHDFDHYNLTDPFDELIFIICSQKTAESTYQSTYRNLRSNYPTNLDLAQATESEIARVIEKGGLAARKAKAIHALTDTIQERFGSVSLEPLHDMSDIESEDFLLSLPGVGKKIARCVMLYSLRRKVFPVDVHCWRITRRIGWVRRTRFDGRCSPRDMDRLQEKIPPELRFSLHVNMVSLGRDICFPINPTCGRCPIKGYCKRIGVRKKNT